MSTTTIKATRAKAGRATVPQTMRMAIEQQGQDFSWFECSFDRMDLGAHGAKVAIYIITACGPFQEWLWKGKFIDGSTVFVGGRPALFIQGEWRPLNYSVTELHETGAAEWEPVS